MVTKEKGYNYSFSKKTITFTWKQPHIYNDIFFTGKRFSAHVTKLTFDADRFSVAPVCDVAENN